MRKLATAVLAFSAATVLARYFVPAPWLFYCGLACAALLPASFILRGPARLRALLICAGLAAGFFYNGAYDAAVIRPAVALSGSTQPVSAVVCDTPTATDYGSRVLVRINRAGVAPVKVQLYINGGIPELRPGDTVDFTARLLAANTVYGERTDSFFARGIFLKAYAQGDVAVTGSRPAVFHFPARAAQAIRERTMAIFPPDTEGLIRALILGDTSGVYEDTALASALSETGTTHIISVSGMNIAFITSLLGLLIRKKRVLAAAAIPVIILFMAVVGFAPPVTRAGIMQIFLLSAPLLKRENDAVTSLSAALFLILLGNPWAAGGAGLQLSFSATLGLILFTGRIDGALEGFVRSGRFGRSRIGGSRAGRAVTRFVIACTAATIGALILSAPLIALHFGSASLIAPLANILILWAVSAAFFGGVAAVAAAFVFAPAGVLIAWLAALPVRYVVFAVTGLSRVPFASLYTSNTAVIIWLVYVYLLFIATVAIRPFRPRRLLYPACLSALFLCFILLASALLPGSRDLTVTALDVGQGQSIVITAGRYTAVVDCGSSSGKDAGEILIRHLADRGIRRIDLLMLTHFHSDHADGIPQVLERMAVSAVAMPDTAIDGGPLAQDIEARARAKGAQIITVTENLAAAFPGARVTLYAPLGDSDENERGLTVLVTAGTFDALITGDMGGHIERRLISREQLPDIELLIVGHHGSKHSTSEELLRAVRPEIAVISVGYNSYGHPAQETLDRLARAGAAAYRTDAHGTVTVNAW